MKQTAHHRRQYVGDKDDDEEEFPRDTGLPTPAHSDRPSSRSEPPSKTSSDAGAAKKTDEVSKSSKKRKETDS
ncbi:hypothetical protein PR202_ga12559 [Eleusine coracana subsp. coracana]|uniref:Uncharacterized protein n=1 Tax=Eleusine coracana subsp. coracana TaxID=191504 RepID=A0AAV5CCI9_ELECO|nr:hypothetical protein PR202_ga12559 [Eleusine coracana subsp. coracana]